MWGVLLIPVGERTLAFDVHALANRLDILEPSQVLTCVVPLSYLFECVSMMIPTCLS